MKGGILLSRSQSNYLQRALNAAKLSTCRQKHGAVIVKGGRVLSVGVNIFRNTQKMAGIEHKDSTYHAETMAVRALSSLDSCRGATIYVARVNACGMPMYSRPCKACATMIEALGFSDVIYTFTEV